MDQRLAKGRKIEHLDKDGQGWSRIVAWLTAQARLETGGKAKEERCVERICKIAVLSLRWLTGDSRPMSM